ncbi:MAG: tryptophan 2,3-dioxygenase family protein [Cytophagaceae bacterium]|nr:tryptophan 2,3-dioxygenase family protein [Cytophagaceae bacterium]MDW8456355.1 tryptophan 2,3-dioxygenase family protein [Cytophagaceae bacterium]
MEHQSPQEDLQAKIESLRKRYEEDGQSFATHLEGALHSRYINYWDYIHLDTLLTLQTPKTDFPDELIFITYHQITELYFKLILHEMGQLREANEVTGDFFYEKLYRMNWFLGRLIESFDIIAVGMDQNQFIKFRAALTPASGFQSVQYRLIEIASTDFINLVDKDCRNKYSDYATIEEMFEDIYWKKGAIDVATGKKSLTLRQFEEKYSRRLLRMANENKIKNLYAIYKRLPFEVQNDEKIILAMKRFDTYININWPLAHYKYAVRYLIKESNTVESTGGTNWQKYLPPRFQKRIFFPSLYSEQEINDWGKTWVETEVLQNKSPR